MDFSKLNDAQQEAVRHADGPLLIIAGAGSGKTRVITQRIAHLIDSRQSGPHEILAVTFTNKAAREMAERVASLVQAEVSVSTFHSLCAILLRKHIDLLGYDRSFAIYDDGDQNSLIKSCMKKAQIGKEQFKPSQVVSKISRLKDELIDPVTYENFATGPYEQNICTLYTMYQKNLRENNALDFSDLIMLTVKLFNDHKDVLEHYQDRFRYLMVDEYQDTNYAQYQLVKLLAQKHQNICVVGDPDQSIYSWRGANIRNILDFEKDYQETTVIKLEHNYRSSQSILDAANEVIKLNLNRKAKELKATIPGGEKIYYYEAVDGRDEADFVAQKIMDMQRRGLNLSEVAVFYRVHALSRSFEEAFLQNGIPYQIVGGMKFYERKEVKDVLAYLRFLVNPQDKVSLQRIINVPKRGIGPTTVAKLEAFAEQNGWPIIQAMSQADQIPGVGATVAGRIKAFNALLWKYNQRLSSCSVSELVRELLEDIRYEDYLKEDDPATFLARSDNLKELFASIGEFEQNNPDATLVKYLEEIALITDLDSVQEATHKVTMMTLHNAKGLEFPSCFIVGMEEGIFPNSARLDDDELEEERRLCYVGITRAEKQLFISSAMRRMMYGKWNQCSPSRFIGDIPSHLIAGAIPEGTSSPSSSSEMSYESLYSAPEDAQTDNFQPGDRVLHEMWGMGKVVKSQGKGEQTRLTVLFDGYHGMKQLMLKYVTLSKV